MKNKEMRREELFSKHGNYFLLVESNSLLHRECIEYGGRVARSILNGKDASRSVRILDLACGGMPVSMSRIMGEFKELSFQYTGIDINPDQVAFASSFSHYPENFTGVQILEGSAWSLAGAGVTGKFDIIFMGANLHHGTPEEVYFLATQLPDLLEDEGVFISHDWYRPDDEPYQRRPDHNPDDASESYLLVTPEELKNIETPDFGFPETPAGGDDPAWRMEFADLLKQVLLDRVEEKECAYTTHRHVRQRDYPISMKEFGRIMERVGFNARIFRYESDHEPLGKFFGMLIASKLSLKSIPI
ncbi:MAG: class I SAM-dependent methyltransferase [Desulfobacterales bacterium]|nr:class I SAM-dependent methyltransferase [Desulfobacterales bacterium]